MEYGVSLIETIVRYTNSSLQKKKSYSFQLNSGKEESEWHLESLIYNS